MPPDTDTLMKPTALIPESLRQSLRSIYRRIRPAPPEPLMYRVHLFAELGQQAGEHAFRGKRILEIGPRDGLDSKRLAAMDPQELVMIDLPEKRDLVDNWLAEVDCPKRYIEANFAYLDDDEFAALGRFDLVWCTGVLYHNAEQLRFLRRLHTIMNPGGWLVLESATLRGSRALQEGQFVQVYWPDTYRDTGTATHLPSAGAIRAWLDMVGFTEISDSHCFDTENRNLKRIRMACFARRSKDVDAASYYVKSGRNPSYQFGEST